MTRDTHQDHSPTRHGRLFELIRRQTLSATQRPAGEALTTHQPAPAQPRTALLPQEQQALGYGSSFGR